MAQLMVDERMKEGTNGQSLLVGVGGNIAFGTLSTSSTTTMIGLVGDSAKHRNEPLHGVSESVSRE